MTIEAQVGSLVENTSNLLTEIRTKKEVLDAAVQTATAQASNSLSNASVATVQNTAANAAAQASASSAAQAATARDLAVAAWSASTAPAEILSAKAQSLHIGTVVKAIVYDTNSDSDGGAWRQRCQDKSWYTETLGGDRWIGQQATIAAAWTAAGSVTGAVFQASATAGPIIIGKYYSANSATTVTEVFRGITREFPAVAGIVAESGRVVIYDLRDGSMFMVFKAAEDWLINTFGAGVISSVAAINGTLVVGTTTRPLSIIGFASDIAYTPIGSVSLGKLNVPWGTKRSMALVGLGLLSAAVYTVVNSMVIDVAITVLNGAEIDPQTGLPKVTIAIGCVAGTSIILDNGSVLNKANAGGWDTKRVFFNHANELFAHGGDSAYGGLQKISSPPFASIAGLGATPNTGYPQIGALAQGYGVTSVNPYLLGGNNILSAYVGGAFSSTKGLTLLKENPATPAKGMAAYISNAYNSGWMPGDIRGTYLADTVAETITSANPQADRSVKNVLMNVVGTLTKAPVAAGSNLVAYSGFSASNYLEQPYNSQLDFGTGDFSVMGWVKNHAVSQTLLTRSATATLGGGFCVQTTSTNQIQLLLIDDVGAFDARSTSAVVDFANFTHIAVLRRSGTTEIWANSALLYSGTNLRNISSTSLNAVLRVGARYNLTNPTSGAMALWRISATAPSADQLLHIYRTELPLFQPGAKCTIDGTSPAVTALAFDDQTDLLHVGTSWGRTSFKDLVRVDSEATTTGSITSLSAQGGTILTGGTSVKLYVPAKYLRDELQRQSEAKAALGRIPVFTDYDAIAAQVAFVLPKGFTAKAVYSAGLLKRAGTTKDYLISTDGFQETVTFAVAPGAAVQVTIMTTRS